jgi:hypothetical protein
VKKSSLFSIAAIGIIICAVAFAAGCAGGQKTEDDPEMTVEHLIGEYTAQLIRDGAEVIFGSIDLAEDDDGAIIINITEKEYVEDPNQPNGFYIAYKNLESSYQLSPEAMATFLPDGSRTPQVLEADRFVEAVERDADVFVSDNPEYKEYKLYDIYVMYDQIMLLLARYIP